MMNNFNIRFATKEDSQTIYNFIIGMATYENMLDQIEGSVEQICDSIFDKQQAEVLIGEENGKPVCFALFFYNYSTFKTKRGLYLEDLYVNEDVRGRGYGKTLILFLAKLAHERGCGRMEWCCLDWNTPSIEFYKSLGATSMDEWTTYRLNENQLAQIAKE